MYIYAFVEAWGKTRTKFIDCVCQSINRAMHMISQTVIQDIAGE